MECFYIAVVLWTIDSKPAFSWILLPTRYSEDSVAMTFCVRHLEEAGVRWIEVRHQTITNQGQPYDKNDRGSHVFSHCLASHRLRCVPRRMRSYLLEWWRLGYHWFFAVWRKIVLNEVSWSANILWDELLLENVRFLGGVGRRLVGMKRRRDEIMLRWYSKWHTVLVLWSFEGSNLVVRKFLGSVSCSSNLCCPLLVLRARRVGSRWTCRPVLMRCSRGFSISSNRCVFRIGCKVVQEKRPCYIPIWSLRICFLCQLKIWCTIFHSESVFCNPNRLASVCKHVSFVACLACLVPWTAAGVPIRWKDAGRGGWGIWLSPHHWWSIHVV